MSIVAALLGGCRTRSGGFNSHFQVRESYGEIFRWLIDDFALIDPGRPNATAGNRARVPDAVDVGGCELSPISYWQ